MLPSLLIDTGGDSLFYTYSQERTSLHIHAVKENGAWGSVDVTLYVPEEDGYRSVYSGVRGDMMGELGGQFLCYEELLEDTEGNIKSSHALCPVGVYAGVVEQMQLGQFNAQLYDPDPTDGVGKMKDYPYFRQWDQNKLIQMDISGIHCAELSDTAAGRVVTITEWDGQTRNAVQVLGVEPDAYIDEFHAGDGIVHITNGEMMYTIQRADVCKWYLTAVEPDTQRTVGPNWVSENEIAQIGRNDGYVYGDTWWDDFLPGHIDLPDTFEGVLNRMDTGARGDRR